MFTDSNTSSPQKISSISYSEVFQNLIIGRDIKVKVIKNTKDVLEGVILEIKITDTTQTKPDKEEEEFIKKYLPPSHLPRKPDTI